MLLVIGENATSGVRGTVFDNAIRGADLFRSGRRRLTIIGPSYSGAAWSIAAGLRRMSRQARIATGCATGDSLTSIFRGHSFHRFTASDSAMERLFYQHLQSVHGIDPERHGNELVLRGVGMLRESGTGWGALLRRSAASNDHDALVPGLEFAFPQRIAELRHRYAEQQSRNRSDDVSLAGNGTSIDLTWDRPGSDEEAPYSPSGQFVSAMDEGLRRLLGQVASARVRYIGIQASDVADALFLTRKLHELAPDARVFILSSDILLMHRSRRTDTIGTYIVSSYPFIGTDDFWNRSARRFHDSFTSDGAEGVYNATLFALRAPCDAAREMVFSRECAPSEHNIPVWLGVLGFSGFEPILFAPVGAHEGAIDECAPDTRLVIDPEVMPPNVWHVALIGLAVAIFRDQRRTRKYRQRLKSAPEHCSVGMATAYDELWGYLLIRILVPWTAFLWMLVCTIWQINGLDNRNVVSLAVAIFACIVAATAVVRIPKRVSTSALTKLRLRSLVSAIFGFARRLARTRAVVGFGVVSGVGALATFWLLQLWLGIGAAPGFAEARGADLFFLRLVALTNGVSPTVPLLFGLWTFWFLAVLRVNVIASGIDLYAPLETENAELSAARKDNSDSRHTPLARLLSSTPNPTIVRFEKGLWREVVEPDLTRRLVGLAVALLFVLVAACIKAPSTIELPPGTYALYLPVIAGCLFVIWNSWELVRYERRLQELLRAFLLRPASSYLRLLPSPVACTVEQMLSRPPHDAMKIAALRNCIHVHDTSNGLSGETNPHVLHAYHDLSVLATDHDLATEAEADELSQQQAELEYELIKKGSAINEKLEREMIELPPRPATPPDVPSAYRRPPSSLASTPASNAASVRQEVMDPGVVVASHAALIFARYVRIVRHYVIGLTFASLSLLAAVSTYPFQPRQVFALLNWFIIGAVAVAGLSAFINLDRNTVLSRIGRTTPGRFDVNGAFALRVFTYVGVPLLGLVLSQYPWIVSWLYRIAEPFLRAIS